MTATTTPPPRCWRCGAEQIKSPLVRHAVRTLAWLRDTPARVRLLVAERNRRRQVRKLQGEVARLRALLERQEIDPDVGVVCYLRDLELPQPSHYNANGTAARYNGGRVELVCRAPDDDDEARRVWGNLERMACAHDGAGGLRLPHGLLLLELRPPKTDKG